MIKFRIHNKIDIQYRVKWLNNPNINRFIGDILGQKTTIKKETQWFDDYQKNKTKKFFTICDNNKPIGFMGLSNINVVNRNADLFIVIGESEYRGKGVGKKAVKWLVDYGFEKLNLHKINLGVIKNNIAAVKLYKSIGFKVEGEMKDEVYFEGKFNDFLSMAIFNKN